VHRCGRPIEDELRGINAPATTARSAPRFRPAVG
jgi:hypothetical protein